MLDPPRLPPRPQRGRHLGRPLGPLPWLPLGAGAAALLALGLSNPGMADFEQFAAERLVEEMGEQVCVKADLPLLLRLAVANCAQLVREQRDPLAAVVRQHSRRINLGLLSLFRSEIGGQRLLGWRLPRVRTLVVGVAGQFLLVYAGTVEADPDSASGASPLGWRGP